MADIELNILGCGSALPTTHHLPSSQVLRVRNKLFMIDCGEGAQLQFRRQKLRFTQLQHIFISHLHGDHCFGLPGLISTLDLIGQTREMVIHAHADAEKTLKPMLDYFCREQPFKLRFNAIVPGECIYEDRTLTVKTLPLKHRVPTCGFLFEEKEKQRHLIGEMVAFYNIPVKQIPDIKAGADFITPDGEVIPNNRLTREADKPVRYAYCSDTLYHEKLIPYIEGVDLLYHESTFTEGLAERARETFHSTALQAAKIAQKAQVKQLLLGHYSARYTDDRVFLQEARTVFPHTLLANEGMVLPITGK